jgi:hypothetical protein
VRKRITGTRAFRLGGGAAAVTAAAVLGTTQTGLVDVDSLLRLTDILDLNPFW